MCEDLYWQSYATEAFNKAMVEISKTNETLHFLHNPWGWPVEDILNLLLAHLYPFSTNLKSHEFYLGNMEDTLLDIDTQSILR